MVDYFPKNFFLNSSLDEILFVGGADSDFVSELDLVVSIAVFFKLRGTNIALGLKNIGKYI